MARATTKESNRRCPSKTLLTSSINLPMPIHSSAYLSTCSWVIERTYVSESSEYNAPIVLASLRSVEGLSYTTLLNIMILGMSFVNKSFSL